MLSTALAKEPDKRAAELAKEAKRANKAGHVVQAYLLYSEAAALDPHNDSYRTKRELLAPVAKLFTKAGLQTGKESLKPDLTSEPPEPASPEEIAEARRALPPPDLKPDPVLKSFQLRGDEKSIITSVANAYGIRVAFDPTFDFHPGIRFDIENADFRNAFTLLTSTTNTFLFPLSDRFIFVARDTDQKRVEYEPNVYFTVPLPDAVDAKDIQDSFNAARITFDLQRITFDGTNRTIIIRDRLSKALPARALLESILTPRPQISLEVDLLTVNKTGNLRYGLSLPTSYPIVPFGNLLASIAPIIPSGFTQFLTFGGGRTLFGVGITSATIFAVSSRSWTQSVFKAQILVDSGQTATFHVGDKYPIAQALTIVPPGGDDRFLPAPSITFEDLGILLKATPRAAENGDVALEIEASYRALGSGSINTIPIISQRELKSVVRLRQGEWAVMAGLVTNRKSVSRNGIAGLSEIPGIRELFGDTQRNTESDNMLLIIKPTFTRLPSPAMTGPSFFTGIERGLKVLL